MLGLLPLASLLLVAGEVDLNATVTAETRAGQAPLRADQDPTAGFVGVLTPSAEFSVRQSNLDLRLDYGPRIFWRQPNEADRQRPLLLHLANLSLATRLTPTVSLTSGASLSAGEVDYTLLPQLVGTVQASLPTIANILVATARAGLDVQVTRLTRVGLLLEATHRRPIGDVDAQLAAGAVFLQPQTSVQAAPNATVRLSRLDDLLFATPVAYRWFDNGSDFLSVTPQIGWRRRLSATDEFRVSGGVTYGHVRYATVMTGPLPGSTVAPVGSAEVLKLLLRHRGVGLQGGAGAMADYYVDPILTVAQKRVALTARLLLSLGDRWTAGVEAALGTTLDPLLPPMGATMYPDATYAALSMPVRHRLAENVYMEFGARWSDRAPHKENSLFEFHQRQLWAYALLTVTTREVPRWGMPDGGDSDRRNRRPLPTDTQGETSVTARVTSRSIDRLSGTMDSDTGLVRGDPDTAAVGATAPLPGQQSADGRAPFDEEDLEPQRQRELPNESQLPIGIGGVR